MGHNGFFHSPRLRRLLRRPCKTTPPFTFLFSRRSPCPLTPRVDLRRRGLSHRGSTSVGVRVPPQRLPLSFLPPPSRGVPRFPSGRVLRGRRFFVRSCTRLSREETRSRSETASVFWFSFSFL